MAAKLYIVVLVIVFSVAMEMTRGFEFDEGVKEEFKNYDIKKREKRDVNKIMDRPLKIVTILTAPYIIKSGSKDVYIGFIPDILDTLGSILNFKYNFYQVPDGKYGSCIYNCTKWTGMIGEVIKNEKNNDEGADMAAAPITMTSGREAVVNFVTPFQNLGLTILVKKGTPYEDKDLKWPYHFNIFRPFAPEVWLLITISCFVVAIVIWLMNKFNPYEWGTRASLGLATEDDARRFNIIGSLWFVFASLQWQGFDRAPRSIASNFLACIWFAFVTVTLIAYTGSLVNHLFWASTVHGQNPLGPPFNSIEELMANKDFDYGTISGGSTYNYLMNVADGAEYNRMRFYWSSERGKNQHVNTVEEGIQRVRKGKYGFIMESMMARHAMNTAPCDLTVIDKTFFTRMYGFAVPHGSKILDELHRGLLMMMESGELEAIEKRWFHDAGECWNQTHVEKIVKMHSSLLLNTPKQVSLEMFWGPLVALLIAILLTFVIAFGEMMFYKHRGRYSESNRPGGAPLKMEEET